MSGDGQRPRYGQDDRVVCPHCAKRMVPRLITYYGEVERTVCPFCAQTYADFRAPPPSFWRWPLIVVGGWLALNILLPLVIWLYGWVGSLLQ